MKRSTLTGVLAAVVACGVFAAPAAANPANSIQPAHIYFGDVSSGNHPNRLAVLHNGTGQRQRIDRIAVSGAGGYVFTLPTNTALLNSSGLRTCILGTVLAPGGSCAIDVRVHTLRPGWWRSVLRVVYVSGVFNSAELRAHVVPNPSVVGANQPVPSCGSVDTNSIACG